MPLSVTRTVVFAAATAAGLLFVCALVARTALAADSSQAEAKVYPVHFPTAGSTLDAADQDTVRGIAASLKGNPALTATIIGKADTVGSADFNHKLSQQRAESVFDALVNVNHVPETQVEMRWTGEHLQYLSTEDQKEEMLNRVVEITVH